MAIPNDTEDSGTPTQDAQADFISRVADKYEKEDSAHASREDGVEDDGEGNEEGATEESGDDESTGTDEHTDAGTSTDDPDGEAAESEEDSAASDDDEHPDDEESDDSEENAETEEEGAEEDDDDADEPSDETKAKLAKAGADLKLDDIPKEYRSIVQKKLANIDSAFSRVNQEATAFRAERTRLKAEEKFRADNPDMDIAERLIANPDLIEKVQARIDKLADADQAEAFKIIVKDKRKGAEDAVVAESSEAEKFQSRVGEVVKYAEQRASTAGLPWKRAEKAVAYAIAMKPAGGKDLTNEEIDAVIKAEAKDYTEEQRSAKRTASKETIQTRTNLRKAAVPGVKRPTSTQSPRPAAAKAAKVNNDSEESRHAAMMKTARRVMPGTK